MISRRVLVLFGPASFVATACRTLPEPAALHDSSSVGLDEFMALSRILTGFPRLDDNESGLLYLNALTASREKNERLAELCERARLLDADDPSALYQTPRLADLADVILRNWYTGTYTDAQGQPRVATYVAALAWQALDHRALGPTTCGGAFGHWSAVPAA
jgi:hypothetical protein